MSINHHIQYEQLGRKHQAFNLGWYPCIRLDMWKFPDSIYVGHGQSDGRGKSCLRINPYITCRLIDIPSFDKGMTNIQVYISDAVWRHITLSEWAKLDNWGPGMINFAKRIMWMATHPEHGGKWIMRLTTNPGIQWRIQTHSMSSIDDLVAVNIIVPDQIRTA